MLANASSLVVAWDDVVFEFVVPVLPDTPSTIGQSFPSLSSSSASQSGRACRNRARNASAPAEDSEEARGEQRRWNSFGTLFRFTIRHSIFLMVIVGIVSMLYAYVFPYAVPTQ